MFVIKYFNHSKCEWVSINLTPFIFIESAEDTCNILSTKHPEDIFEIFEI